MMRGAHRGKPSQVLAGLHDGLQSLLGQDEREGNTDDGLGAGICFVDLKERR
jgi:hypothetical protein